MISLEWTLSPWWLTLCVLVAGLAAWHLYHLWARVQDAKPWQRVLMAGLRFIGVLLIAVLLLRPMVKRITSSHERKYVAVLVDNSRSMGAAHDGRTSDILSQIDKVASDIASDVESPVYYFDRTLHRTVDTPFVGRQTDIAGALKQIREEVPEERLAGIILATDGIYTQGRNPQYMPGIERIPIYAIGMGDTIAERDLAIADVLHNPVVYKGDALELEVDLQAKDLAGKTAKTTLMRRDGDRWTTLNTLSTKIDRSDFYEVVSTTIEATAPGLIRYRVATSYGQQDHYPDNNIRDFYVEVIASRQRILLYALSPHPDLSALAASWTSLKNYEVDIAYSYDDTPPELSKYDLVILHQLPSKEFAGFQALKTQLDRMKKPRWYILGGQSDIAALNAAQPMAKIATQAGQTNEVNGRLNATFSYFKVSDESGQLIRSAPPLTSPFGTYTAHPSGQKLWSQTISGVETDDPLLVMGSWEDTRQAILLGEGIWRWRIYDYVQQESHDRFDNMVQSIAQYLAVDANKKRFDITKSSSLFDQHEAITLSASYFNESYELDNSKDIELQLIDEHGDASNYVFSKVGDTYKLELGRLGPGRYTYVGGVVGDKKLSARGSFEVRAIDIEMQRRQADHQLLQNIASKSGGRFVPHDSLGSLVTYLLASPTIKPTYVSHETRTSILDLWWLLPIILAAMAGEWFMRKYVGSY